MRAVFMGTPDFAVPFLKTLVETGHDVPAVVTQPDRRKGRGKKVAPPPVKITAQALNIPVFQPSRLKDPDFIQLLRGLAPEVIVVVAYGRILPADVLLLPKFGCINVHASLLPKYRGAAPIHWAVINGEKETGVTTMYMDEGLDTGDMILRETVPIYENDTVGVIHDRLAGTGAPLLVKTLQLIGKGSAPRVPQTGESSYAPMLKAEDEPVRWGRPAREIHNQIRGMNPWPGARTHLSGRVLKLWGSVVLPEEDNPHGPGRVLLSYREGIVVGTGKGNILITELQLQGGKRLKTADFLRGTPVGAGTVLGNAGGDKP